jgi:UDP-glucose 4-epimerase
MPGRTPFNRRGRYLVTGGCGFIGSHLADRLAALGHEIRILDDLSTGKRGNVPPCTEIIVGNIAEGEIVRRAMRGMTGCFHLAAIASVDRSNQDPLSTNRVNLIGTLNVLRAAAESGGLPVVYASSAAVYGANPAVPLSETSEALPLSVYGADKLACEMHARVATHLHRIPTVGLRLFNVYGARQDPSSPYSGVISIFANRLRARRNVTIHGDGKQMRDFIHVADVVEALLQAMARRKAGAIVCNVCTGRGTTIGALAELLAEINGARLEIAAAPPRPGDIPVSIGDPRRARDLYRFAARISLRDGLRRLLREAPPFAREHPQAATELHAEHAGS